MIICKKCGTNYEDGIKFCPECGEPAQATTQQENEQQSFKDKIAGINNTADETAAHNANDIAQNKGISVLSYLGPLVFIPMFARKNSKYARFHANQGLTLLIVYAGYGIVQSILTAILWAIFPWRWDIGYFGGRGVIYDILSLILSLVWVFIAILAVLGIINAAKGKAKELPLIGKFKFLK